MSEKGRTLQIFRDGRRHEKKLFQQLPVGAQGNLETLAVMKRIVREDSRETDLKAFVMREIVGLDKRTSAEKIGASFSYCRDRIIYSPERDGFETVADLWSCLYALNAEHASGDCAIKSVALATCLAFLGLKPEFVAVQQIPNADWFNHVYVSAVIRGKKTALDATPPEFRVGDETGSFTKLYYQIF